MKNNISLIFILLLIFTLWHCGGKSQGQLIGASLVESLSDTSPAESMVGDWLITNTTTESGCSTEILSETYSFTWSIKSDGSCHTENTDGYAFLSNYDIEFTSDCKANENAMAFYSDELSSYIDYGSDDSDDSDDILCATSDLAKTYDMQFVDGAWTGEMSFSSVTSVMSSCGDGLFLPSDTCSGKGTLTAIPLSSTVKIVSFTLANQDLESQDAELSFEIDDPYSYTYVVLSPDSNSTDGERITYSYNDSELLDTPETTTYTLELRHDNDDGTYVVVDSASLTVTVDPETEASSDTEVSSTPSISTSTETTETTETSETTETENTELSASVVLSDFEVVHDGPVHIGDEIEVKATLTNTGEVTDFVPKLILTPGQLALGSPIPSLLDFNPTPVLSYLNNPDSVTISWINFTIAAGETTTLSLFFTLSDASAVEAGRYRLRFGLARNDNGETVSLQHDEPFIASVKVEE